MMFKVRDDKAHLMWRYIWNVDENSMNVSMFRNGNFVAEMRHDRADDSGSTLTANTSEEFWEWLPER